jgi:Domain of unknown function (DUF5625)
MRDAQMFECSEWVEPIMIRLVPSSMRSLNVLKFEVLCVLILLFVADARAAQQFPVVPFKVGEDKSVEFSVNIARYRNYRIDLIFYFRTEQQRAVVKKIVGEPEPVCRRLNDCGETSSFEVTVMRGSSVVFRAKKEAYGYYAHGASEYYRNILILPLRPGQYSIKVEVNEFGEGMRNADTAIEVSTDSRERDLGE